MKMVKRGALIVLEGVDKSGKTTHSTQLLETLKQQNLKSERITFPDRTTWTGKVISDYLSKKETTINAEAIHLLFSANRWENVNKIRKTLNSGTTLIVDRYIYSGIVYSTAKGLDFGWCLQAEVGLPQPDFVFLMKVELEDLKNRRGFGEEKYETLEMQKKVSDLFNKLAANNPSWMVVNASRPFEEVHKELVTAIVAKEKEIRNNSAPLGTIRGDLFKNIDFKSTPG